jgi:hypothetical protein
VPGVSGRSGRAPAWPCTLHNVYHQGLLTRADRRHFALRLGFRRLPVSIAPSPGARHGTPRRALLQPRPWPPAKRRDRALWRTLVCAANPVRTAASGPAGPLRARKGNTPPARDPTVERIRLRPPRRMRGEGWGGSALRGIGGDAGLGCGRGVCRAVEPRQQLHEVRLRGLLALGQPEGHGALWRSAQPRGLRHQAGDRGMVAEPPRCVRDARPKGPRRAAMAVSWRRGSARLGTVVPCPTAGAARPGALRRDTPSNSSAQCPGFVAARTMSPFRSPAPREEQRRGPALARVTSPV